MAAAQTDGCSPPLCLQLFERLWTRGPHRRIHRQPFRLRDYPLRGRFGALLRWLLGLGTALARLGRLAGGQQARCRRGFQRIYCDQPTEDVLAVAPWLPSCRRHDWPLSSKRSQQTWMHYHHRSPAAARRATMRSRACPPILFSRPIRSPWRWTPPCQLPRPRLPQRQWRPCQSHRQTRLAQSWQSRRRSRRQ